MSFEEQELELLATIQRDMQAIHYLLHLLLKSDPVKCDCLEHCYDIRIEPTRVNLKK